MASKGFLWPYKWHWVNMNKNFMLYIKMQWLHIIQYTVDLDKRIKLHNNKRRHPSILGQEPCKIYTWEIMDKSSNVIWI